MNVQELKIQLQNRTGGLGIPSEHDPRGNYFVFSLGGIETVGCRMQLQFGDKSDEFKECEVLSLSATPEQIEATKKRYA